MPWLKFITLNVHVRALVNDAVPRTGNKYFTFGVEVVWDMSLSICLYLQIVVR